MLTKFWDKVGESVAGEWKVRMLTPAFAFWGGAFLVWVYRFGWQPFNNFMQTANVNMAVALIVALLFLLLVSSVFVSWLALPFLRLLEGYWPKRLGFLRDFLLRNQNRRLADKEAYWSRLADDYATGRLSRIQLEEYAQIDAELDEYPVNPNLRMPTKIGNILRAGEEYPERCFGLEINITWLRLWLLLPESTKKEISKTREDLNQSVQFFIWGLLFSIWVIWAIWPVGIALIIVFIAYRRIQRTAFGYSRMLRAVYDLNRFSLYKGLHWPLPADPASEKDSGRQLSIYLKRNIVDMKLSGTEDKHIFMHGENK